MKRVTALGATVALLLAPVLVRLLKAQAPSAPPPPPTFTLTDLGSMNGASGIDSLNVRAGATALNSNAQVAGYRLNLSFGDQPIGFLWDKGNFTDLGTGGGPQSYAYGINSTGQIVGTSNFVASSNFPGDLTGNSSRAFIYLNGVMTILDADPNFWSRAYAINAGGDVAGFIATGGPFPVIWKGGTAAGRTMLQSLPCSLASCQGEALAINDLGQAAGWSVGGNVNVERPVMWDSNGQPTDLIPNPGFYTQANGINNNSVVVGYYQPQQISNTPIHAFSWQSGTLTDLGAIGTDTYSGAWGINTKGDIVGISATTATPILTGGGGRAFLRTGGVMYDLTTLLAPGTNWILDAAFAINDSGQLVGIGHTVGTIDEHGFLLTPIITPTTTSVSASVNPSVFGQQVSFTATVTPTRSSSLTPTGNVTFNDGSTVLGTVALTSGKAIFNTAGLAIGAHTITASYGGDNNFGASTSTGLNQVVSQAATSTALVASPNPANVGQSVTLTATVNVTAPGAGVPTGTVNFLDGTTTLGTGTVNGAGTATFSTPSLAAGSHAVTATYNGDTNFTGSTTSSAVTVTVQVLPPPPVQIVDNETITVTDTESFPEVFDAEAVHVADAVFLTPLIQVSAPVAEFSAGSLGFSGQSGSQTITVSDIGTASLSIASVTISGSPQFAITQIACSNGATSSSMALPSGGVCMLTIGYSASATPANDYGTLQFTDNAALSNLVSTPAGSSYMQSIPLSGSGTTTAPPPPPPAVVPVTDNETIQVTDTESFSDAFDAEAVHVNDAVFVTPLINVAAPVADYSAGGLGFGNVPPGQTGTQSLTVSNIGQAPLMISSAALSKGSAFAIAQISCSNGTTSLPATLVSGGACNFLISYVAPTGIAPNDTLTFTDNAALSNVTSLQAGSNYMQSISLSGSGTNTPPPPPPPAVIPIVDTETIHVTDTESFSDLFDAEAVHVNDAVFVTPLINVAAPVADYSAGRLGFGNVTPGQTGTQSLTLSNIGQAPLAISSASVSPGSAFTITQIACSNSATSFPSTLPIGGACALMVSYLAPAAAPANDMLTFTDDAALSNVTSVAAGSSYTQSILLSGSGTTTPPPPPPPAVVPVIDNETIHVMDTELFSDVIDSEQISVIDQVSVQVLDATTTSITLNGAAVFGVPISVTVSVSSPTAAVTGNVALSVDGGTPSTLLLTNGSATFNLGNLSVGLHALAANFPAQANFLASSAATQFTVAQATPTITWVNPPAITFGTALSGNQLNATAPVPGMLVYNPPAGTVLGAGSQTLSVVFAPNDKADYTKAAASVTLLVNKAIPVITWVNPAPITLGTPLSSAQLNATASVSGVSLSGTFVYNPPLNTVLAAGTQNLSVTFTPTDTTDYQTVTQTVSITVNVNANLSIQPGQIYTFSNGSISGNVMLNGGTLTLIGSTVGGSLTMSSGSLTLGGNSTVNNNVQIQGGSFSIGQASIKGNLQITNVPAGKVPGVVCGASVSGDLQFQYNAILGQIGPPSCAGNRIGGNLMISNNKAPLQIFKNAVGGNLQVQSNTGSAQVFQNTVQNALQCSGNSSPFTGGQNTAANKQGQCANF